MSANRIHTLLGDILAIRVRQLEPASELRPRQLLEGHIKQVAAEFERTNYAISADLPEMADPKTLSAKMENGVLTVIIKKRAESQPKQIEIL